MKNETFNPDGPPKGTVCIRLTFEHPEEKKPESADKIKISIQEASRNKYYETGSVKPWPDGDNSESFFKPSDCKIEGDVLTIILIPDIIRTCRKDLYTVKIKDEASNFEQSVKLIFDPQKGLKRPPGLSGPVGSAPPESAIEKAEPVQEPIPERAEPTPIPAPPVTEDTEISGSSKKKILIWVLAVIAGLALILGLAWTGYKMWSWASSKFGGLLPPISELDKTGDLAKSTDSTDSADSPDSAESKIFPQPADSLEPKEPTVPLKPKTPLAEARELIKEKAAPEEMESALNRLDQTPGAEDAVFLLAKVLAGFKPQYRMRYAAFMDPTDERPTGSIKKDFLAAYAEYLTAQKNGVPEAGPALERLRAWVESQSDSGDPNLARFRKLYGGD